MTVFLALIAAAGIILTIRSIVIMDRAEKVMSEVATKARDVANLAAALKAQNDAMREKFSFADEPPSAVRTIHLVGDGDASQQRYINGRGPLWFG